MHYDPLLFLPKSVRSIDLQFSLDLLVHYGILLTGVCFFIFPDMIMPFENSPVFINVFISNYYIYLFRSLYFFHTFCITSHFMYFCLSFYKITDKSRFENNLLIFLECLLFKIPVYDFHFHLFCFPSYCSSGNFCRFSAVHHFLPPSFPISW